MARKAKGGRDQECSSRRESGRREDVEPFSRDYFSQVLGLSDKGLDPRKSSFEKTVSRDEVALVFGWWKAPIWVTERAQIDAELVKNLLSKVYPDRQPKIYSFGLYFARGVIAHSRGVMIDWATFACESHLQHQTRKPRTSRRLRESEEGMGAQLVMEAGWNRPQDDFSWEEAQLMGQERAVPLLNAELPYSGQFQEEELQWKGESFLEESQLHERSDNYDERLRRARGPREEKWHKWPDHSTESQVKPASGSSSAEVEDVLGYEEVVEGAFLPNEGESHLHKRQRQGDVGGRQIEEGMGRKHPRVTALSKKVKAIRRPLPNPSRDGGFEGQNQGAQGQNSFLMG